jgi:hypothetical protein
MLAGIHDEEGRVVVPEGGWVLNLIELSGKPGPRTYDSLHKNLIRANWGYGSTGTIPIQSETNQYIAALGSFAATTHNAFGYIIGNEPNHEQERPNGVYITPEHYADTFIRSYQLLKSIRSNFRVIVAAMAPYHAEGRPWTQYMREALQFIGNRVTPDGIAIHAYTRSMDPAAIQSNEMMGPPLSGTYSGFRTYRDALDCIPLDMRHLPVYCTEFNVLPQWEDRNTGVIQAAYAEIREWNEVPGNQRIECLLPYRWPKYDRWSISDKPQLIQDLQEAFRVDALESLSNGTEGSGSPQNVILIPSIKKEPNMPPSPPTAFQRQIDKRASDRGVSVVEVNNALWKVKRVEWFNEQEADGVGPDHHILFDTIDENGNRLTGVKIKVIWSTGFTTVTSEAKVGERWSANFPMTPGEFSAMVEGESSEMVRGIEMGQDTPGGFNPGIHTSTEVVFQKVAPVQVQPEPEKIEPMNLSHPIREPNLRRITQLFGANPEDYARFGMKGHTGIDFGVPLETPIYCVDNGQVIETGNDEDGYGIYAKVRHQWGESLYAHLSNLSVKQGESVDKGELLGLSGNSGNSTGPHLHFAMRIVPYNRGDGWDGFSDPLPYLVSRPPATEGNWERAWPLVLQIEGRGTLSTDRNDKGNYRPDGTFVGTRWGISALAYPNEDIVNLTKERALFLYKRDYWEPSGAGKLPWPLALLHFDSYVQNPGSAMKFLNASGGNPALYLAERIRWYTNLDTWEYHGKGWMRRCATMLEEVGES